MRKGCYGLFKVLSEHLHTEPEEGGPLAREPILWSIRLPGCYNGIIEHLVNALECIM
jgi:hypothetical protein